MFQNARKEVRVSLKTGFIEESRTMSMHIYLFLSRFYIDFYNVICNNEEIIEGIGDLNINKIVDNVINDAITKGFDTMFDINSLLNKKTFGFETHTNGISLKSLQGSTQAERDQDFQHYQEYIKTIVPALKDLNVTSEPQTNEPEQLKPATFSDLIESYCEHKRHNGWENEITYNGFYQKLMIILELVGDVDCSTMSQQTSTKYLSDLIKLPANSHKGDLAKLSLSEKLNLPDSYKRLSKSSINKYVSLFKAVTKYGSDLDPDKVGGLNFLKYDIGAKLKFSFSKNKDTKSYSAFTDQELQKLLSGYVYTDQETNRRKSDDWVFWIILLAMYTGARVNELAQLLVEDIKWDDKFKIWYINILDDEQVSNTDIKQSVKTDASRRKVPIHSQLIKLKFLDFVNQKRTGKYAEMLFSTGLNFSKKGKWGKAVSDWFNGDASRGNGYKVDCGFERNTGKVFHSFHHSFAKKLLGKKGRHVDMSIIGALIGHEQVKNIEASKITFIYTENYNLSVLKAAIEELEYDIDLSGISYRKFKKKFRKK